LRRRHELSSLEAYHEAGRAPTGVGLLIGAVGYYALTQVLNRRPSPKTRRNRSRTRGHRR